MLVALLSGCLPFLTSPAAASQQPDPAEPAQAEAFRLRITNTDKGPIEISVDRGATYHLIARVTQCALKASSGARPVEAQVERSSPRGIALAVGQHRLLRILPDSSSARKATGTIAVNVGPDDSLFRLLVPPTGSPVLQEVRKVTGPLPSTYTPADGDQLVIVVSHCDIPTASLPKVAADAAIRYLAQATRRLTAKGGHTISGTLRITARLQGPNDRPNAVWISVDAGATAILNTPPYEVQWNTADWADGEHLIDIRALDTSGGILTRAKSLVITHNHG